MPRVPGSTAVPQIGTADVYCALAPQTSLYCNTATKELQRSGRLGAIQLKPGHTNGIFENIFGE